MLKHDGINANHGIKNKIFVKNGLRHQQKKTVVGKIIRSSSVQDCKRKRWNQPIMEAFHHQLWTSSLRLINLQLFCIVLKRKLTNDKYIYIYRSLYLTASHEVHISRNLGRSRNFIFLGLRLAATRMHNISTNDFTTNWTILRRNKQLKPFWVATLPYNFKLSFMCFHNHFANKLTPNHRSPKFPNPNPQHLYPPNVLPWKFWQSSTQGRTVCWEPHTSFKEKCEDEDEGSSPAQGYMPF